MGNKNNTAIELLSNCDIFYDVDEFIKYYISRDLESNAGLNDVKVTLNHNNKELGEMLLYDGNVSINKTNYYLYINYFKNGINTNTYRLCKDNIMCILFREVFDSGIEIEIWVC